ncbi:tyrosine-type recombinase/integrase [Bacillus infantis]|uniref:tyrosine-type recombinase/integrase n=1 Tax=Bacillus infantis TaxID=324767 RepID=UPI003CEE132E
MLNVNHFDLPIYTKKFIKYLERLNYSKETINGYTKDLKKFREFIYREYKGSILTEHIEKEDLIDYLNMLRDKGLKQTSIGRNLSTLKSFFKFLVYEQNFNIDVAARIKHPKMYSPLPDVLDDQEMNILLQTTKDTSSFYYALFSLLYYTGSRLTPVRIIKREHVDLRNRRIYFEKVKNGKDLYLPLNQNLYHILNEYMLETKHLQQKYLFNSPKFLNKPISPSDVRNNLRKISKLAGITKRVTPHVIRHCTATHLTLKGVDQKFVSSILGHTDLRSTARYQRLNVENLRPSINQLGFNHVESSSKNFVNPIDN